MAAEHVVVVGASLAGHSVVEALAEQGYAGHVTVLGAEPHAPYDRPPLSKAFLAGKVSPADLALGESAAEWRFATAATGLDVARRTVALADGSEVTGDLVVVATGARARTLPGPPPASPLAGVHTLRSLDDAVALRADLRPGRHLVVVGGGFIGCEVAATALGLGLDVTVVEAGPVPLAGPLGLEVGTAVAGLHERRGISLRCGVGVTGLGGTERVSAVVLADGTEVACDVVLVALGSTPNTEWLAGSGLDAEGGVRCDEYGVAAPGVVAVGDCAAWFDPVLGRHHRVEHWTDAFDRSRLVAASVVDPTAAPAAVPAPYFWSDQHGVRLQFAGRRTPDAEFRVEGGGAASEDLLGVWWQGERPIAVLGMNRPRDVARWRRRLVTEPEGARA